METVPMIVWTVLKASAIPVSAAIVAHWYTGSDAWSAFALLTALVIEGAIYLWMQGSAFKQNDGGEW